MALAVVPKRPSRKYPPSLSKPAGDWWLKLTLEFGIEDPAGLILLETALQAWDRQQQAAAIIAERGLVLTSAAGNPQTNPAVAIERDARSAFLSAMKSLNLDIEPLRDGVGRPPGVAHAK